MNHSRELVLMFYQNMQIAMHCGGTLKAAFLIIRKHTAKYSFQYFRNCDNFTAKFITGYAEK